MPSLGMGLGTLLVASSLFLPACSPGQPEGSQSDGSQDTVTVDDSKDTVTPGDNGTGTPGDGDGQAGTTTELDSGVVIRETPIEYLPENGYEEMLAAYDAIYKDGDGRYKGVWYACSLPQGYSVPAYKMQHLESEEDRVNGIPNTFVADSSPNKLSVRKLSNGMLAGAEDHGSISLQCRLGTYDELISRSPQYYATYQEGQPYAATTGVNYRMLVSGDSTIAFPQVGGSVASVPFVTFSHVPEETVHEFLNDLQVVADPGATQVAYMDEHGIQGD